MTHLYHHLHSLLRQYGDRCQSALLLAIRLFWGGSFILAGLGKLLHLGAAAAYFKSLGIPLPMLNALVSASVETIGGACLFLGLASRLVSLPLIFTMIVAFATAESEAVRTIFSDPQNFIHRTPFSFLFASLLVFVFGPGRYSLDERLLEK